jgi:hypothetical protein
MNNSDKLDQVQVVLNITLPSFLLFDNVTCMLFLNENINVMGSNNDFSFCYDFRWKTILMIQM